MDIQTIIDIDRQLLGIINGNHNMFLDTLMLTLTSGLMWIPLYVALLYLVVKNNETMGQIILIMACAALCFFLTEFVTEGLVKPAVARPRPGNDPEWMYMVHVVNDKRGLDYSFFSAHAANTFGIAMFFCLLVRNSVFSFMMVTWSLINCYTRLYLAMHYPSDILTGLLYGAVVGSVVYLICRVMSRVIAPKQQFVSSQYTSTGYSLADVDVVVCVLVFSYLAAIIISLTMHYS
jgi:undecaprenyl-diphosphatase